MTNLFTFLANALSWLLGPVVRIALPLLLAALSAQAQIIRYVSPAGSNSNPATATSWAASTTALQGAIDASNPDDQVWIANGTYVPGGAYNADPTISFHLKNGVAVYGGFAGIEASLDQRPASSPSATILSGVLAYVNYVGYIIEGVGHSTRVIDNQGLDNTARLDGVVITGGGGGQSIGSGGGIRNINSSATFVNCLIQGNVGLQQGGGVYNQAGSPRFTNCTIRNNTIALLGSGGGMANIQSSPVLTNCRITDNSSGGLYNQASSPQLTNCLLSGNRASSGGAMSSIDNSSPRLVNCLISGNTADFLGGGIYDENSSLMMTNCTITANRSQGSYDIVHLRSNNSSLRLLQLTNCILYGNGPVLRSVLVDQAVLATNPEFFRADYCLFQQAFVPSTEPTTTPQGTGNLTTAESPFISQTDFTLKACSPAIDAGSPASTTATSGSTDLAGNPRIYDTTIDIGAYEFQGPISAGGFPLRILQQPASGSTVTVGASVSAMVSVSGSNPTYQWYKNNLDNLVPGQTSATLSLSNVQLSDEGAYFVVVTGCQALTSTSFELVFALPIRYVRPGGTGNGSSWPDASGDLQTMINRGQTQVYVTGGRYTSSAGNGSFALKSGVAIYGGFNPDNPESSPANRASVDPLAGVPSSSTLTTPSRRFNGSVISNTGVNTTAVLDGFVITEGFSLPTSSNDFVNGNGGGIKNVNSSPSLNNCVISGNVGYRHGGGLYNENSSPRLSNCVISDNASSEGGGIYNLNSSPHLINCTFSHNGATSGGALSNNGSSHPVLINSILWNNQEADGNAIRNDGSSALTASYCLIGAGETDYVDADQTTQELNATPFQSPDTYQLSPCSLAINAGDPASTTATSGSTDLAGKPRVVDTTIDIGAYEFQGQPGGGFSRRILQQPVSGSTVTVGTSVSVMVSVSGSNPTFQWYKNDLNTPLPGQTSATLSLSNVQLRDAGAYFVVVSGSCNSLTSTAFSLNPIQPNRYVRAGAGGDGTSWANASGDLTSQINAPDVTQVWVAQGTYTPTGTPDRPGTDRSISFNLKNSVSILGGFPPTGAPALTDRNPARYPSILSGDIGQLGDNADNSYQVIVNTNPDLNATAILDGFVITGGNGNVGNVRGGGVSIAGGSPRLLNCTITGNQAYEGGGLSTSYSSLTLVNCSISDNTATGNGGGIYTSRGTVVLVNGLISRNTARGDGGGIFTNGNGDIRLLNATLSGNVAVRGGALLNQTSNPSLTNCVVFENGGSATFATSISSPNFVIRTSYCLLEATATGYSAGAGNLTVTSSPFASSTSFQLLAGSPAVNAGDTEAYSTGGGPPTDLAGNPRIQNGVIDLGAYESALSFDLAPRLTTLPTLQYGTTPFSVVVEVFELNGVSTGGAVSLFIAKDPQMVLSFEKGLSQLGGKPVGNGSWSFDGTSNPNFYLLSCSAGIGASGKQSVGLSGVSTPDNTKGRLTISTSVSGGSGMEGRLTNNSDADTIEYFKK